MTNAGLRSEVLVYNGEGAGARSVQSALQTLRSTLRLHAPDRPSLKVATLSTADLLAGGWRRRCLLLVMPGGADLPYCRHLNGAGNQLINGYVREDGGAYLGLCAGAYYASARVEFEPGSRLEVVGDRELRLFEGTARGAVVPGFSYMSEAGAAATELRFMRLVEGGDSSGAELDPLGCTATDAELSDSCQDYCNGGPAFIPSADDCCQDSGSMAVLARYQDCGSGGIAALVVRAGSGRAVLAGTHPELHPDWLAAAANPDDLMASGSCSLAEADGCAAVAAAVQQRLADNQAARMRFWRLLLTAAGLGLYLLREQQGSHE